ncbi:MAG: hypothetical protein B7Z10_05165 [Rhodobacterales bacterium 32-66-7]|nr:MAG: hypothetical protein B7Z10_05165 [Rhodobacterales bacterium 32-66-7]
MVRPGYKQTEVGVIPDDWDAVPIGEMFTFKNGLNKAKGFFGYGTPIVNYMDVFGRPSLQIADVAGRVDVNSRELASYEVRKGDVFFTRTSETVEEIGVASVMLDEPHKTVFSGFVLRARPSGESLDDGFKAYCFAPRYFRQQVTSNASYTTRALTNGRSLSAALLARPPLPEQRAIAAALSNVDAALAEVLRLIAKKKDLKQAAMQTLLTGQTRLPGFSGDWEVKRLGDVGEALIGLTYSPSNVRESGILVLRSSNIQGGALNFDDKVFVDCHVPAQIMVQSGDVLICARNGSRDLIGKSALLDERTTGMTFGAFMAVFRSPIGKLVNYLFQSEVLKRQIHAHLGATINQITNKSLNSFEIPLAPTFAEQTAIAAVLSDMDAEIVAVTAQADKIRLLKQAMMQDLLTGRVRLPLSEVTDA